MDVFIKKITKEAGKKILKLFGKVGVKYTKAHASDPVTEADLVAHRYLISQIKKKYPSHRIISEEGEAGNKDSENVWIIDPLDGTLNFSRNTPMFGVLVAFMSEGVIEMGVSYTPYFDEMYFAKRGKGAYKNGERIRCASRKELRHSHGCATASVNPYNTSILKKIVSASGQFPFGMNGFGAGAFQAPYVADGRRDWIVLPSAKVWDLAPLYLILKEAGCKVTNLQGHDWTVNDESFVAANPTLHKDLLKILK